MQRLSGTECKVDLPPANIGAAIVNDDLNHVASVADDEAGAERQTAMGNRHTVGVEFAAGRDAVTLPVDGSNHEAGRPGVDWGQQREAKRR